MRWHVRWHDSERNRRLGSGVRVGAAALVRCAVHGHSASSPSMAMIRAETAFSSSSMTCSGRGGSNT